MTEPTGADEVGGLRGQVQDLRRQLADAHARLNSIVERSADGAMVIDALGVVVYANPAAHRLLGRADGQLVGEHLGFPVATEEVTEVELVTANRERIVAEMRVVATEWAGRPATLAGIEIGSPLRMTTGILAGAGLQLTGVEQDRTRGTFPEDAAGVGAGRE